MSIKLTIGLTMFAGLIPLMLIAMLAGLTRKRFLILVAMVAVAVMLAFASRTRLGGVVAGWLAVPPHTAVAVCVPAFLFVAFVLMQLHLDRTRCRRLAWETLPSQQEFSKYCIRHLERLGWKQSTAYSTNQMTICRMEKEASRRTFIITATPADPRRLATMLRSLKWKDYGQHVVVTWRQQVPTYSEAANAVGWDVIGASQLRGMNYDSR